MVRGYYTQIVAALRAAGCVYKRAGKGDHEIWYSPISRRSFTVDKGSLSRHTANAVMRQAGIDRNSDLDAYRPFGPSVATLPVADGIYPHPLSPIATVTR